MDHPPRIRGNPVTPNILQHRVGLSAGAVHEPLRTTRPELCHQILNHTRHQRRKSGRALRGCGGQPATLLQDLEWRVVGVRPSGVSPEVWLQDPPVTVLMDSQGALTGRAPCNRYAGSYKLTGEGLQVQQPALTRMACAPHRMAMEGDFMAVLNAVNRFERPNAVTLMSEYCPSPRRALLTNAMFCGFPLGAAFGGFLAAWMIPLWGWRSVLVFGGVSPLLLLLVSSSCLLPPGLP